MRRHLLCLVVLTFACHLAANAQDSIFHHLNERIAERISMLNDCISFMTDKSNDLETRQFYKKRALKLFVGQGYTYEENGIAKDGVRITITSTNKSRPRSYLVRTYFNGLINLAYPKVSINFHNIDTSSWEKVNSNLYVCFYYFVQQFIGYRDGTPIYKDITRKKVKCYVEVQDTEYGKEYVVLLGDIYAIDTKQ